MTLDVNDRPASRPWILVGGTAVLAAFLLVTGNRLTNAEFLGYGDFLEYWSAGRLCAAGDLPYNIDRESDLQVETGWQRGDDRKTVSGKPWPIILYNPPWTLPFLIPFGILPFGVARLLWLVASVVSMVGSADCLWRYYGGPSQLRWLAWTIAFTFVPTLIALKIGQIGPFLLLGAAAFLACEHRRWDALAGSAAVLLAIKPHLFYLFWIALILWGVEGKRWHLLLGGAAAGLAATAIPLALNPHVLADYWNTAVRNAPRDNLTPSLGATLRLLFGEDRFWLQFLPTLAGVFWVVPYWWHRRKQWDWATQMPRLLLIAFLTTSYGWSFDLVVLLVPTLQAVVWIVQLENPSLTRAVLGIYLVIEVAALTVNLAAPSDYWFVWMAPALALTYVGVARQVTPASGGLA